MLPSCGHSTTQHLNSKQHLHIYLQQIGTQQAAAVFNRAGETAIARETDRGPALYTPVGPRRLRFPTPPRPSSLPPRPRPRRRPPPPLPHRCRRPQGRGGPEFRPRPTPAARLTKVAKRIEGRGARKEGGNGHDFILLSVESEALKRCSKGQKKGGVRGLAELHPNCRAGSNCCLRRCGGKLNFVLCNPRCYCTYRFASDPG